MYPPAHPFNQKPQQPGHSVGSESTFQTGLPDGSVSQPLMNPLPATTHFQGYPNQARQTPGFQTQGQAFQQGSFPGQLPLFRGLVPQQHPILAHPLIKLLFGIR